MENIYDQFIDYLKKEEYKLNLKDDNLEKHHILPLHAGGKNMALLYYALQKIIH